MRKKKWLLITIIILISINVFLLVLPKIVNLNRIVSNKLTAAIGKTYNADISFGNINATTKFLQLSDVSITERDGKYSFSAIQLYFGFNFWRFVFNGFHIEKAIDEISCFSPNIEINYTKPSKHTNPIDWNKIRKYLLYFSDISLINGKIDFKSELDNTKFHEILTDINLSIKKIKTKNLLDFSARNSQDTGDIKFSGFLKDEDVELLCSIKKYSFSPLKINDLLINSAKFSLEFPFHLQTIHESGFVNIKDIDVEWKNQKITSQEISLTLKDKNLFFDKINSFFIKDAIVALTGKVENILTKNRTAKIDFSTNYFNIRNFNKQLTGEISLSGSIRNRLSNPTISHQICSSQLAFRSQTIKDLNYNGIYQNSRIDSINGSLNFLKNDINFSGNIGIQPDKITSSNINIQLNAPDFQTKFADKTASSSFVINITSNIENPHIQANITNIYYAPQILNFDDLNGNVDYKNDNLNFTFSDKNDAVKIQGKYINIFHSPLLELRMSTQNLHLNKLLQKSPSFIEDYDPIISSDFKVKMEKKNIYFSADIEFPDRFNKSVKGKLTAKGNYSFHLVNKPATFSVNSDSLYLNGKTFTICLDAEKGRDSLNIKNLKINDQIDAKFCLFFANKKIEFTESQGFVNMSRITFDQLKPLNIIPEKFNFQGFINGKIETDKSNHCINGEFEIDSLKFSDQVESLNSQIFLCLNDTIFRITDFNIKSSNKKMLTGNGKISLEKPYKIDIWGAGNNVNSTDFTQTDFLQFNANYSFLITGTLSSPKLLFNSRLENGKIFNTRFDNANIQVFQDSKTLYLNEMNISRKNLFDLSARGKYSFNIFTQKFYDKSDGISLDFSGDVLDILSAYTDNISNCESRTNLHLLLASGENGPSFQSGSLSLNNGKMNIKGQPETVRDLNFHCTLSENIVSDLHSSFKMRKGEMTITNNIGKNFSDIILGNLNLGTLLITTSEKGIGFHLPEYTPEKSIAEVKVSGFQDKYFRIYKENDNLKFMGKVLFSNGTVTGKKANKKKSSNNKNIFDNLAFDINLVFQKNIWYVDPPLNLRVDQGDYIKMFINPNEDIFQLSFDLHSQTGDMRLFGETFRAKEVTVSTTKNSDKILIDAEFEKKTADGSIITLWLKSTDNENNGDNIGTDAYGKVKVWMTSDGKDDGTMLSILSKLHYGRDYTELDNEEKNALAKDEVIYLASDELGNMLISPFLSPFEGAVRKFLGLDFFRVKTGFMKNLVKKSGLISSQEDFFDEQNVDATSSTDLKYWGRDIILDDLSFDMGKYITRDWYVDYKATIQKGLTFSDEVDYGLQHQITLRYDLPWNMRFLYMYRYSPILNEDIQRITLEAYINF
ncbi:MAG: hypothetical protein U9P79_00415 [Candidatus Cloacimonadota bacterium]|nr:hypothetical protein [Candidatus Cloacimonadota bacterium]